MQAGTALLERLNKGDVEGHPFRGNQWTSGEGGGEVAEGDRDRVELETDSNVKDLMANDPAVAAAEKLNAERGQTINDPGVLEDDGKTFTAAAQKENDAAKDHFFKDAKPVTDGRPQAYLVIGRPGSGKSSAMKQPPNTVLINSDDVMGKLPGYDPKLAPSQYQRASAVTDQLSEEVVANGYNMYYDGTGKTPGNMTKLADRLEKAGYDIHVVMVDNPRASQRAYDRFTRGGRYVPAKVMADTQGLSGIKKSYDALKSRSKSYQLWDNSGAKAKLKEKGP